MPRAFSSGSRSGSMPVSARTSVDLPWSMWPAVPMTTSKMALRSALCCGAMAAVPSPDARAGPSPQRVRARGACQARAAPPGALDRRSPGRMIASHGAGDGQAERLGAMPQQLWPPVRRSPAAVAAAVAAGRARPARGWCGASVLSEHDELERWLQRAEQAMARGEWSEALAGFERALVLAPDSPAALAGRGEALYQLWRFEEAAGVLARAARALPEDAAVHRTLAVALDRLGRQREAARSFRTAHRLDPERYPLPYRVSARAFDRVVREALAELPPPIAAELERLAVVVHDYPTLAMLGGDAASAEADPDTLGLFWAEAVPERFEEGLPGFTPGQILLFQRNLENVSPDPRHPGARGPHHGVPRGGPSARLRRGGAPGAGPGMRRCSARGVGRSAPAAVWRRGPLRATHGRRSGLGRSPLSPCRGPARWIDSARRGGRGARTASAPRAGHRNRRGGRTMRGDGRTGGANGQCGRRQRARMPVLGLVLALAGIGGGARAPAAEQPPPPAAAAEGAPGPSPPATAPLEERLAELERRLAAQEQHNASLRQQLHALQEQRMAAEAEGAPPGPTAEPPLPGESVRARARQQLERLGTKGGYYAKPFLLKIAGAHVGGYFDLEYRDAQGADRRFVQHRFIPFIFGEITEQLRFAAEIEFEFGGTDFPGGDGETKVEFAALDYEFAEWLGLRAGALLVPLGKFNLVHDSPVNDLTDRPLVATAIIPTTLTEAGAGIFGTWYPAGELMLSYEAYVMNGFKGLIEDASAPSGFRSLFNRTEGLRKGRASMKLDNNNSIAFAGRLGFSPALGAELGTSYYWGRYDDKGDNALQIVALDWTLQPARWLPLLAGLELQGEVALAAIERDALARSSGVPNDMWGIYAQINYHVMFEVLKELLPVVFRQESTFTLVGRLDHLDLDGERRQIVTLGVNFRPVEDTVFKFDYQFHLEDWEHSAVRNDAVLLSVASYF
ncbi:MAG: hypothetical protein KatS3mg102_1264 [Planctomycetota bacterium]|nr:MAG: hypothetical protein KatS3mg102_1264 [Planctomycetota bacterium]